MTSKRERPAGDGAPQRVTARRLNSLSPTSPKIEIQAHDAFVIELAVTKNTFDGSPRPPDGEGGVWSAPNVTGATHGVG